MPLLPRRLRRARRRRRGGAHRRDPRRPPPPDDRRLRLRERPRPARDRRLQGTQTYFNVAGSALLPEWLAALGSPSLYTTATIDQSAKLVTAGRLGAWDAGRQRMLDADVMLLVGTNPLVAVSTAGWVMFNVAKRLREAKARGLKLVVVDPPLRPDRRRQPRRGARLPHRLTVRRLREVLNSLGSDLEAIRRRRPYNPAWLHPEDLAALGLGAGDRVEIGSAHGRIAAIALPDAARRRGVVSMSHGWGALPGEEAAYEQVGASTNRLVATDRCVEAINAMPRLSAIPVDVRPLGPRSMPA